MSKARELAELSRTVADSADAVAITVDSNENTTFTGVVTANAGVVVDNITIDGTTIALSSGILTLDVAGDIRLDAGGGNIQLIKGGTEFGRFFEAGTNDFYIYNPNSDKDIIVYGNDSGTSFEAVRFDMSNAGAATFNAGATFGSGIDVTGSVTADGLTVDTDTLVVDATNNRVGIGTSSPTNGKLVIAESGTSVGSTIRLIGTNTSGSASQVSHITSYQPAGGAAEASALDFKVRGTDPYATPSTVMTLIGGGNAGIGTTSPDYRLEVEEAGTGSGLGGIAAATATAGGNAGYRWVTGGTARFAMATIGSAGLEGLRIYDNNNAAERMRIDSSGNVGIGQSVPYNTSKLDVVGSIISTSQTIGTYAANNAGFDYAAGTKIGRFFSTSSDATGGHMTFITGAGGGAERLRIDASGNVGIGTATITSGFKLEVIGDARFGDAVGDDAVELGWSAGGSQGFIQAYDRGASDASGNLLVGTTSNLSVTPKLAIESTTFVVGISSTNPTGELIRFYGNSRTVAGSISHSGSSVAYNTSSDQRLKENIADADDAGSKIDAIKYASLTGKLTAHIKTTAWLLRSYRSCTRSCISPRRPRRNDGR
jgi:hypothetical protein